MFPRHHRAPNWATHVRSRYIAAIGSSEAGASHCNLPTLGATPTKMTRLTGQLLRAQSLGVRNTKCFLCANDFWVTERRTYGSHLKPKRNKPSLYGWVEWASVVYVLFELLFFLNFRLSWLGRAKEVDSIFVTFYDAAKWRHQHHLKNVIAASYAFASFTSAVDFSRVKVVSGQGKTKAKSRKTKNKTWKNENFSRKSWLILRTSQGSVFT